MAGDKEGLSTTAAKAKRNVLFFAAVAWALACGWIKPSAGGRVDLAGIGAETLVRFILWGLVVLLGYNLVSFLIHAPIGRRWKLERISWLLDPSNGPDTYAEALFDHITGIAGPDALPTEVRNYVALNEWLSRSLEPWGNRPWNEQENKGPALTNLWNALSKKTQRLLSRRGLPYLRARLAVIEYPWDVWIPLAFGTSGLGALAWALWHLC